MSKPLRPLKAIRAYCLDCSGGSFKEVEFCPIRSCPLYAWRFGKRPKPVQKAKERASGRGVQRSLHRNAPETILVDDPSAGSAIAITTAGNLDKEATP